MDNVLFIKHKGTRSTRIKYHRRDIGQKGKHDIFMVKRDNNKIR